MFRKLDDMKMKRKLSIGYIIVILMMAAIAIFAGIGLLFLDQRLNQYVSGPQAADTAVEMCRIEVNIAARNLREMALNTDSSMNGHYEELIQTSIHELEGYLSDLKASGTLDDQLYTRYETAVNDWIAIGNNILQELKNGDTKEATQMILNECAPALQTAIDIAKEISVVTDAQKAQALLLSERTVLFDIVLILIVLAVSIFLAVKIGSRIIKAIIIPLEKLDDVTVQIAEGNLHVNIDHHAKDEMGDLAHNLRKSIRILSSYVEDISHAMKEFSNGNFDVQPEVEWKGDFINILDSFMYFEKNMASTIKNIQSVADQVSAASEQVSASSMELAEGASEQSRITEELTATISNVSAQIRDNADNAEDIRKDVESVGQELEASNEKMQEMANSMEDISHSSQEISKIIAAINDIASQTNLLALNASIEAARAGEAGRGFAVVADQVSTLAAQSAEAAKESTSLIEDSVHAVEKGMVIADEMASQLENVVAGSRQIIFKVNGIAEASEAQAQEMLQLSEGVDRINGVVQTNSATSEECAAASEEMTAQAETLKDLIRHFKVGKF